MSENVELERKILAKLKEIFPKFCDDEELFDLGIKEDVLEALAFLELRKFIIARLQPSFERHNRGKIIKAIGIQLTQSGLEFLESD